MMTSPLVLKHFEQAKEQKWQNQSNQSISLIAALEAINLGLSVWQPNWKRKLV